MSVRTVLITGASSGIGAAAADHFHAQGWNVVATMRQPPAVDGRGPGRPRWLDLALDVTDTSSIDQAFANTISAFGRVDVVVNNAGYGLSGSFESIDDAAIRRQFDTNVFGLMAVSRAALPHFRAHGDGCLINVSSMGGRLSFPFYAPYHASKWAVEGFSESLAFEAALIGVRVKLIEPGAVRTSFYGRSAEFHHDPALQAYGDAIHRARQRMNAAGEGGSAPNDVAAAILRAANDRSARLRYPVGRDAKGLLGLRRWISDGRYQALIGKRLMA